MIEILKLDDPMAVRALEGRPADEPVHQIVGVDSEEDLELLRQIAAEDGLEVEEPLKPEFVVETGLIILGIIGTAAAVAGAINYCREKRRGGQVIDLTKTSDEERFRRVRSLQYGLVVVIAADGNGATVDVKEPRGFFLQIVGEVVNALAGPVREPADKVIEIVREVVGSRGHVSAVIPAAARA